jgi:hypothetical protein
VLPRGDAGQRRNFRTCPISRVTNAAAPGRGKPFFSRHGLVRSCQCAGEWRACFGGSDLTIRRKTIFCCGTNPVLIFFIAFAGLLGSLGSASAQGIFEALFGRWTGPTAYADPHPQINPFGGRESTRSEGAGSVAYCVRTCDGRYFPIQRHGGISAAQACSSFCPASTTKIYSGGSSIDHALGADGKRYAELSTAFVYREKIVPGCTCNGKDAFGLVSTPVAEDTTLRPGDIVATNGGLMAYNGTTDPRAPNFTPINSYAGVSAELRQRLTETKVAPATETATPAPAVKQAEATVRNTTGKRAQADR